MPVSPTHEDAAFTQEVDQHRLLGLGRELLRRRRYTRVAGTSAADVAVREDAVVPVGPQHAKRVAANLRELVDTRGVGGLCSHERFVVKRRPGGKPHGLGRSIRAID